MRIFITTLAVCTIAAFNSCNIVNPAETVPTYVRIDSFSMQDVDPSLGTLSEDISSVFVYYNNDIIGAYDLPATFPVAVADKGQISVFPAITFGGLNNFQIVYPYYRPDTLTITAKPGETIQFTPKTGYVSGTRAVYKEDFELGNGFIKLYDNDTSLVRINDSRVFEGAGAGYMYVDATHPKSEVITSQPFQIPAGDSYLEINYKGTTTFFIGLQTISNGNIEYAYMLGVKPQNEWSKIYLGLQQFTGTYNGKDYRLLLKASVPDGASSAEMFYDNIKIVSF